MARGSSWNFLVRHDVLPDIAFLAKVCRGCWNSFPYTAHIGRSFRNSRFRPPLGSSLFPAQKGHDFWSSSFSRPCRAWYHTSSLVPRAKGVLCWDSASYLAQTRAISWTPCVTGPYMPVYCVIQNAIARSNTRYPIRSGILRQNLGLLSLRARTTPWSAEEPVWAGERPSASRPAAVAMDWATPVWEPKESPVVQTKTEKPACKSKILRGTGKKDRWSNEEAKPEDV